MKSLPTARIENIQRVLLIIGAVLPFSSLMICGFMLVQVWEDLAWNLGTMTLVGALVGGTTTVAAFVVPALIQRVKMEQLREGMSPDKTPESYGGPILETIQTSKIIQLTMLEGASMMCFVLMFVEPSLYLLAFGLAIVVLMFARLPFPGWVENRFKDCWSELTGKGIF